METMLKFLCNGCDKEFIVTDHQVDTDAWPALTVRRRSRCPRSMTKGSVGRCGAWQKTALHPYL